MGGSESNRNLLEIEENVIRTICREEDDEEAYYCTFPSFVDCCRLTARRRGGRGLNGVLMLLTLAVNEKKGLTDEREQLNQMMLLRKVLKASLRRGDIYTRCGNRHYILMLTGMEQDMCEIVFKRIRERYGEMGNNTGRIWYQIIKMKESEILTGE